MSRRGKLTRADREKRQAKRERRARELPERQRRQRRREQLEERYVRARLEYEVACCYPQGLRGERAVCEKCRLEQPRGEGMVFEDGLVTIAGCDNCGHEYAETVESYA